MTRVDANKYSVLIRGDYLYALSRLSSDRQERDKLIQQAVEDFLKDSFETRRCELREERPRVRITFAGGQPPPYHMYLEFVRLPDHLVQLMDVLNRIPGSNVPIRDLGTVLNAAIRVFLQVNHPEFLADSVHTDSLCEVTDHV